MVDQNNSTTVCKYCSSTAVFKAGSYNGMQRYLCKACGRKFKPDGSLFHMTVPVDYVSSSLSMYYSGSSINDIRHYIKNRFDYIPPRSLIPKWINKFSRIAQEFFEKYSPQVKSSWIIGKIPVKVAGQKMWLLYVIDKYTHFLLSLDIYPTLESEAFKSIFDKAIDTAQKYPSEVLAFLPRIDIEVVEQIINCDIYFISNESQSNSTCRTIMRLHGMMIDICTRMPHYYTVESAQHFFYSMRIDYNYFTPQNFLKMTTPAEKANIKYSAKSWKDVCSLP